MEVITTWLTAATINQTPSTFLTGIFLALFSVSSLLLSTSLIRTVRLAGFTCGLLSQPFWFYTAIDSYNLGLFINSVFFSAMWIYRFTPAFRSHLNHTSEPAERETNARHFGGCKFDGWQCFHCGEVFETFGGARNHFGADPTKEPGCLIKIKYGDERGLEMELRKAEAERDALQYQIDNESTQADLAIQRMQTEHQIALRREEEKGYARGLNDGRTISQHSLPDATGRTAEDYAIEHAEYMAVNGEQLIEYLNEITDEDEGRLVPDDRLCDYISGIQSGIYEFRKRRDRCVSNERERGAV